MKRGFCQFGKGHTRVVQLSIAVAFVGGGLFGRHVGAAIAFVERTTVVQFVAKKNSMDRKNKVWPCLLLDDGGPGFWKHEKMYEVDSDLLQKTRFTNLQKETLLEKFAFRFSSVFTIYISLSQTLIFQNWI